MSGTAFAGTKSNSLGVVIGNSSMLGGPLFQFIHAIALISGIIFILWGLIDLVFEVSNPQKRQNKSIFWTFIKMIVGSILMGFTKFLNEGTQTFFGANIYISSITGHPPGAVSKCLTTEGAATDNNVNSALCVANNIATNITPILNEGILTAFSICGAALILKSLINIANMNSPKSKTTFKRCAFLIVLGSLLCGAPYFLTILQTELGVGNGFITTSGQTYAGVGNIPEMFQYSAGTGSTGQAWSKLMSRIFYIFTTGGFITIGFALRMFKRIIDEQATQKDSLLKCVTMLICGIMLANPQYTLGLFGNTLFGYSFGFGDD